MKINVCVSLFFLFFCLTCFTHCDDEFNYIDELSEKDRGERIIDNYIGIKFYYIDENGHDLINLDDRNTYPVSYYKEIKDPLALIGDAEVYKNAISYNNTHNNIAYDEEEGLYYCKLTVYWDGNHTYSSPVYINGTIDWIKTTFMYRYIDGISGRGTNYIVAIRSLEYEGQLLYAAKTENYNEEQLEMIDKKVFIKRGSDGSRTVSFTR